MIVDVQRGFIVPDTASTVPAISEFVRRERHRYGLVIATRFVNRAGSLYETERDWHGMMSEEDVALVPEVASVADVVVTKHGHAPDPADLMSRLRGRDVQVVDLCGFDTDQCVLATALLLWDAGFVPRVLGALCASSGGTGMHETGLAVARRAIGDRNVVDATGQAM